LRLLQNRAFLQFKALLFSRNHFPTFELPVVAILPINATLQHPAIMALKPPQKSEMPAIIEVDIEQCAHDTSYLNNSVVQNLAWSDVTVTVPDRETKLPKQILSAVSGYVVAGKSHASCFQIQNTAMRSTFRMRLYLSTHSNTQ